MLTYMLSDMTVIVLDTSVFESAVWADITTTQERREILAALAQAIAAFDVEMRFKTLAAGADRERALAILDRLDDAK